MADIWISCPLFGKAVPTGITTDVIILDTLDFELTMHCPCHRVVRSDGALAGYRWGAERKRRMVEKEAEGLT
jgi:hypothetical protein